MKDAAAATAVAMGCLRFGLEDALAEARVTGRPVLTETKLNNLIARMEKNRTKYIAMLKDAKADLKGFLTKNFTLTPEHVDAIDKISPADRKKINEAIDYASKTKEYMRVNFFPRDITRPPMEADRWSKCYCVDVGWAKACVCFSVDLTP